MGADLTDILGTDRAVHTHDEARRVIEVALERHEGPCPQAYADVLSAYVAATDFGRANLFLEVASRGLSVAPPSPELPAGHQSLADFASDAIRDASAINVPAFPLDAEQIVRLTGAVLTRVLNASRPADSRAVEEEDLTVALGEAAGVPLPIARNEWGILRLQPYGAVTAPTKDEPASQQPGGSREG